MFSLLAVLVAGAFSAAAQTANVNAVNAAPTPKPPATVNANVTNTPAHPVPVRSVDEPGRHGFQQALQCSVNAGQAACFASFTVPNVQTLVIEYVDILSIPNATADPTGSSLMGSDLTISGLPGQYHFDLGAKGFNGVNNFFVKNELVKIYVPGSMTVTFAGRTTNVVGNASFEIMISGYVETL